MSSDPGWPRTCDFQTVKLLAAALIKAAHWAEAEVILGELSALVPRSTRISALYRSLIAFHLSRLSEASAWFAQVYRPCGRKTTMKRFLNSLSQRQDIILIGLLITIVVVMMTRCRHR